MEYWCGGSFLYMLGNMRTSDNVRDLGWELWELWNLGVAECLFGLLGNMETSVSGCEFRVRIIGTWEYGCGGIFL